jgi:hypothetical protein
MLVKGFEWPAHKTSESTARHGDSIVQRFSVDFEYPVRSDPGGTHKLCFVFKRNRTTSSSSI